MAMNENVVRELERRCKILIANARPDEIATGMTGSLVHFTMALAPIGYPSDREAWMDNDYVKPVMSDTEFYKNTYDLLFERLHDEAMDIVNAKRSWGR